MYGAAKNWHPVFSCAVYEDGVAGEVWRVAPAVISVAAINCFEKKRIISRSKVGISTWKGLTARSCCCHWFTSKFRIIRISFQLIRSMSFFNYLLDCCQDMAMGIFPDILPDSSRDILSDIFQGNSLSTLHNSASS